MLQVKDMESLEEFEGFEELSLEDEKKNEEREEKESVARELLSWVMTFAIAIAAALILKNYVIINANVPTGSMENTIMPGDDLMGFRLSYLFSEPKRGDIVIFNFPDNENEKFIKRVIGLPGETVVISDSHIYINGSQSPLIEDYLKEEWNVSNDMYEFQVPQDSYLVMGDNRNDSYDARYWENTYVTRDEIIGKAQFIYYPFNHAKSLKGE